jgi:hypothetical protein
MSLPRLLLGSALALSFSAVPFATSAQTDKTASMVRPAHSAQAHIQIALLLDTSNSMDGLIAQAKSQLWMLVNELSEGEKYGRAPKIELALYEYGNSNISVSKGYVRQVLSLTDDLDAVSEKLFSLTTNGGQEYAGQVIDAALSELEWSNNENDMKLVIIAGNEPFTQGPIDYQTACARARRGGVIIDTIHCGSEEEGIKGMWKAGADCGGGLYMTIDQDEKVVHIPSPYDDALLELNIKLNKTYIGYGANGDLLKQRQVAQDANAGEISPQSQLARVRSKSSSAYTNESWDLIDAYKVDKKTVLELEAEELPVEMKNLDDKERVKFIEEKQEERTAVQSEITELEKKRQEFLTDKRKEMRAAKTLDNVMVEAVRKQASENGFSY